MMKKIVNKFCKLALIGLPILAVSPVETSAVSLLNDSESFVVAKSEKLGLKDTSNKNMSKKISGCSTDSDCRKGVCVNSKCVTCRPSTGKGCKNSQKCTNTYTCVDSCQGVSCPAGKTVKDRTVAHACTCTACLVDTDCGQGKKCNIAASSANNACANCADGEGCNCPDDQVSNGAGGCKCAPISCPNDGTACGTKTLTNGKCVCAEQSCPAGKVWSSKYCRCETPCAEGYVKDTSGNCTLCDVGYEKDILGVCVKADSCEALGYVTAFSTETGKECGDAETVEFSEKGPTINGQSCYKCVYKTCAQMGTGLTDDAATCSANRPYTVSPLSHAVLTEYKAGSGFYLPSRTGNALVTASCVLCDSCTVYGQYCTACNSVDGCTECSKSGYSIDMQGNCTNTCTGYVENEICVPCNPGSKFKKSCSPCAAGEVCGCTGGKVSDGKGACVSCLTQQPACCGKGGMVNGCYVCDACKTDHFVLSGGVCTLQTCKQYYGNKTFNIGDSDDRACKNKGGYHVVATKSAYPKADCSSLSSSTECGTCEQCPAGQKAAKGDSDCSACPAGYKCPSTGMLAGIACNNGMYQDQTGQTACKTCPAGTYTPNDGKAYTACIPADCGNYVPSAGQNHQTKCAAGTYQPDTGKTSCINATCGQYVPSEGQCSVSTCPAGTYQADTKKTECVPAACGHYVPTAGLCTQTACAAGTYQPDTGRTSCIAASKGYYAATAGLCAQTACAAGTYQPETGKTSCINASCGNYVPTPGQSAQTPCAKGYYQPDMGKTTCIAATAGYYVPTTGQCSQTAASCGNYVPTTGQSAQTPCAAGTYQNLTAQSSCKDASCGNYVATAGQCAQTPCAAGTYQPNTKQTGCAAAAAGYYVPTTGQCAQTPASCGYYVPTTGQSAQTRCAAGTYQPDTGKSSCIAASPGYYANYAAPAGQNGCAQVKCPLGMYCATSGCTVCKDCPCGSYANVTGLEVCYPCSPGYYAPGIGNINASSCVATVAGEYASGYGNCTPKDCAAGTYTSDNHQESCKACSTISVANGTCAECTTTGTCTKVTCSDGYYVSGTTCKLCEAGYYCTGGVRNPCHAGAYQDQTGQTTCKPCSAGRYAANDSKPHAECTCCAAGTFAASGAATGCSSCPSGTFANSSCSTGCIPCTVLSVPTCGKNGPYVAGTNCSGCNASTGECTDVTCRSDTVKESGLCCVACGAMFGTCATCTMSSCTSCPSGYYPKADASCSSNQYWEAKGTLCGQCTNCPSGKKPNAEGTGCVDLSCAELGYKDSCSGGEGASKVPNYPCYTCSCCSAGYYSTGGTSACQACNTGYTSNACASKCTAKSCSQMGYVSSCSAGYGATPTGTTGSDGPCYTCTLCSKGYYSAGGTSACTACPSGQTTAGTGSTSSSACQPASDGCDGAKVGTCAYTYVTCPSGWAQVSTAGSCKVCNPQQTYNGENCAGSSSGGCTSSEQCSNWYQICSSGSCVNAPSCEDLRPTLQYRSTSGTGYTGPAYINVINKNCYVKSGGCTSDSQCASNETCSGAGACGRLSCAAGKYATNHACTNCPAGTYKSDSGYGDCTACPAGKYASGTGNTSCTNCSAGTYASGTGNSSCTVCPAGQSSSAGASSCTACAAGHQGSIAGGVCVACSKGTYAAGTGNTSCTACPSGQTTSGTGSTSSSACYSSCSGTTCSSYTDCSFGYTCSSGCCQKCLAGSNETKYCRCGTDDMSTGYGQCQGSSYCFLSCSNIPNCNSCTTKTSCGFTSYVCSSCKSGYKVTGSGICVPNGDSGQVCPPACGRTTTGCSFSACSWHGNGKCTRSHAITEGGHVTCDTCSVGTRTKIGSNDFYSCCTYNCQT